MKLEKNDVPHLFSSTNVPDIFFTEYLPQMPYVTVKLYIYMVFISKFNKEMKLNDISKTLDIPLKDIQESSKYLEDNGLITRKPNGYIINNLQEIELHKLYKQRIELSPEEVTKNSKNKYRAQAIENINNLYFQGMMTMGWYSDIELWFSKYLFDEQVMIALFNSCYNKSKLYKKYVSQVADDWYKHNIRTFSDLEIYMQEYEKVTKIKLIICKKLGYTRKLNEYENVYVDKWVSIYKYDLDIIEIALRLTLTKPNIGFEYIDKTITDWHSKGLKTVDEIKNYLEENKKASKSSKPINKTNSYNNYEQRKYENLDDFYAN